MEELINNQKKAGELLLEGSKRIDDTVELIEITHKELRVYTEEKTALLFKDN